MYLLKGTKRKNPIDFDDRDLDRWYASIFNTGTVEVAEIAKLIEMNSSLSEGDVLSCLQSFFTELSLAIEDGKSVKIGEIGTFHPTLSSNPCSSKELVTSNMLRPIRIRFIPSAYLKKSIKDGKSRIIDERYWAKETF